MEKEETLDRITKSFKKLPEISPLGNTSLHFLSVFCATFYVSLISWVFTKWKPYGMYAFLLSFSWLDAINFSQVTNAFSGINGNYRRQKPWSASPSFKQLLPLAVTTTVSRLYSLPDFSTFYIPHLPEYFCFRDLFYIDPIGFTYNFGSCSPSPLNRKSL